METKRFSRAVPFRFSSANGFIFAMAAVVMLWQAYAGWIMLALFVGAIVWYLDSRTKGA